MGMENAKSHRSSCGTDLGRSFAIWNVHVAEIMVPAAAQSTWCLSVLSVLKAHAAV